MKIIEIIYCGSSGEGWGGGGWNVMRERENDEEREHFPPGGVHGDIPGAAVSRHLGAGQEGKLLPHRFYAAHELRQARVPIPWLRQGGPLGLEVEPPGFAVRWTLQLLLLPLLSLLQIFFFEDNRPIDQHYLIGSIGESAGCLA